MVSGEGKQGIHSPRTFETLGNVGQDPGRGRCRHPHGCCWGGGQPHLHAPRLASIRAYVLVIRAQGGLNFHDDVEMRRRLRVFSGRWSVGRLSPGGNNFQVLSQVPNHFQSDPACSSPRLRFPGFPDGRFPASKPWIRQASLNCPPTWSVSTRPDRLPESRRPAASRGFGGCRTASGARLESLVHQSSRPALRALLRELPDKPNSRLSRPLRMVRLDGTGWGGEWI